MNDFVERWQRNAASLQAAHAYDPAQEHDVTRTFAQLQVAAEDRVVQRRFHVVGRVLQRRGQR